MKFFMLHKTLFNNIIIYDITVKYEFIITLYKQNLETKRKRENNSF
jgi:hypothetical protein